MTSKNEPSLLALTAALQEALAREEYLKQRTLFLAQALHEAKAALTHADARAAKAEEALNIASNQDGE